MENSNGQDSVRQLMELLLPAMRERVATMGVEASGAFEFYRVATERGRVFNNYEIGVVELIKSRFPALTEIHEVGCGWGQLVFLLAWSGYVTTGFEIDERRYAGAAHFHRVLRDLDEPRASRARILNEFFPPLTRPNPIGTLALSTNIVIGNPRFVEEQNSLGSDALPVFGGQYRPVLLRAARLRASHLYRASGGHGPDQSGVVS